MGNLYNELKALVAIAPKDDDRYYFNGVYVTPDHMTVTDGHRILRVERETAISDSDSVILCRKALDRALKMFRATDKDLEITVAQGGDAAWLGIDDDRYPVEVIDGRFPDVDRVIAGVDGKLPAQGTPVGMQLKYVAQMSSAIELARRDPKTPKSNALKAATFELFGPEDVVRIKAGPVTGWISPCRM